MDDDVTAFQATNKTGATKGKPLVLIFIYRVVFIITKPMIR
jgi:hypothetical protein